MIECVRFKPHNSKTLTGFADLFIPSWNLELYNCTLHTKDGKRWLGFPSKEYTNPEGEKKYLNYFRFRDSSVYTSFCTQAIKSIDKWCKANNISCVQSTNYANPFECAATAHSDVQQDNASMTFGAGQPVQQTQSIIQNQEVGFDELPF